jgi:hypothetical protein
MVIFVLDSQGRITRMTSDIFGQLFVVNKNKEFFQ